MTSQWKPGQSGNPKGRPPGGGRVATLRAAMADRIPEVIEMLTTKALAGDTAAAKLLLERTIPPLRAQDPPLEVCLENAGSLTEQGRAVLQAIGRQELDPSGGALLLNAISQLARLAQVDELTDRITTLEQRLTCKP